MEIDISGTKFTVEAAVSSTLPVPVLLGRVVAGLLEILHSKRPSEEVCIAVTRARAREMEQQEAAATDHEGPDSETAELDPQELTPIQEDHKEYQV